MSVCNVSFVSKSSSDLLRPHMQPLSHQQTSCSTIITTYQSMHWNAELPSISYLSALSLVADGKHVPRCSTTPT